MRFQSGLPSERRGVASWHNQPMGVRLFIVLLAGTLLAVGGLMFAIDRWQDELGDDAGPAATQQQASPPPAAPADDSEKVASSARVRLQPVGRFDQPLYVDAPPADTKRVFVVERPGRIRVVENGNKRSQPFLDISGDTSKDGEQGLLGLAFAPDYSSSGRFYVDFTDQAGDTRIQEFTRSSGNPNLADKSSRRQLLRIEQPYSNHNGGQIAFGPDKLLYIGMGDGGGADDPENRAQNPNSLLGKILRIDPNPSGGRQYTSPESNPFNGRGGRDEIYSMGLRNPYRFSFDRKTGDLYIGDVGQGEWEEIDFAKRGSALGKNYGWSCREGKHPLDTSRNCGHVSGPIFEYSHSRGGCSVTGGVVIRDPKLSGLKGRYVYGDFCLGQVRSFKQSAGRATGDRALGVKNVGNLSSFGEDAKGRVYVVGLDGPVYRLKK